MGLPHGAHAQQGQDFGHVVAVGAHGAGSPHAQAHALGIAAGLLEVAGQHLAGQLLAHFPGRLGGQGAGVHGVEIAARGQNVGHAPGGRATGPGRHVATREAVQQIGYLVVSLGQIG